MRVIAKRSAILISGLMGTIVTQAINPIVALGDKTTLSKHHLQNGQQRFLRSSTIIEQQSDDAKIIPLQNDSSKFNMSLNRTIHTHIDDSIDDTRNQQNRTNRDFVTITERKNLEYLKNYSLNETTLIISWNGSNVIIKSNNDSLSTETTAVAPSADSHFAIMNHTGGHVKYWLVYFFGIMAVSILYVIFFESFKKRFIHPILRRLGWVINDAEPLSPLNTTPHVSKKVDNGPISKKAGLKGMLMTERKLVVNEVFKHCQFCYDSSIPLSEQKTEINEQNAENEDCGNILNKIVEEKVNELMHSPSDTNISSTCQMSCDETSSLSHCTLCKRNDKKENHDSIKSDEVCSCGAVESSNDSNSSDVQTNTVHKVTSIVSICDTYSSNDDVKDKEDSSQDPSTEDDDNESVENDDENQCSICLSTLKDKSIVMRTNKCEHVFHVDCSMGWFHKKDYCPYCRCEIMTPTEMIQAAIIVLGKDRVEELRRRNKMVTISQEPQQQEPQQHDEPQIQNEAETDSNSTVSVQSQQEAV